MQEVVRSALVPYSALQMFEVVNNVSDYPRFLPWCVGSEVLTSSAHEMVARLDLAKTGIQQSFITKNELDAPNHIHISLVEGPFTQLAGDWYFRQLGNKGCKVHMDLKFDFDSRLMNAALGRVFTLAVDKLVDAFCDRADVLYGK